MYEKITLCLLILLVIARSEKISTAKNVKTADLLNSRLSTVLPYPSLNNDKHLIKDNSKKSLVLLMPVSQIQNKQEKSKEMVKKKKRCDTHQRNRFLSTKEDNNRARTAEKNINVGTSKQNSSDHTTKNTKYSQKNSATAKRMVTDTYEDKTLLRPFKDNLNKEDVIINLKFPEKAKKCNAEKYICHCEEENCSSSSSKENSSKMLGSSTDEPKKVNHQRKLTKHENAKANILQQHSPKLYHENPYRLPLSNLINYFPIQSYSEKILPVPVLYEIMPNVLPHMVGNEEEYIDVGIPFTSFQGRPNYLVGNNQHQPIVHKKPCSPIISNSVESSISVTNSPSTDYVDAITSKETTNDLESNDPIDITEEDQEYSSKLTTEVSNVNELADSETESNLNLNYSTDVTEEDNTISSSNLNKIVPRTEDFTEQIERNLDNFSKLRTYSPDDTSSVPFVTYDGTNDGKFINMEECIQLFGRNVCVLSAISPKLLVKQAQENNPNKYSAIRIPEYVTQISTRNDINHSDKLKATDPYFASESSTNEINKSNVNTNEYLESTSKKSNDVDEASLREFHQYPESIKKISESDVNYNKNTPFNTVKNTHTPIKKLIDSTIDEITTTKKSKLLGKSKSRKTKLLLNPNEKVTNPALSKKLLYATPSYESNSNEEANKKINQQNQVTNINSNSNTSQEETTTIISYNSETDSKEQNRNYLKESNTNIYSKKKIPQEPFTGETTTSSNFKTGNNFVGEMKKEIIGIGTSIKPGEIPQEQSTIMQYFDDKKSSNLNNKEDTTNNNIKTIVSSTNKLPFCDNTLLLNSIRKVINDFTSGTHLTKTKDFDENILQTQGKNLLPEILQVPNLKNILSMPQIENMIVEKVKNVLAYVTAIPKKDFTNDWSHGVIKNTLHSILDALSGFHHELPPLTLEEHQFKDGQWQTNLVTLAPILDQTLATPKNLRDTIKDLLSFPSIASQIRQNIVRNIIIQSVKNNLTNDEDDKIDDLIIHELNNVLQMLKNSEDIDALGNSNEVISDEADTDVTYMQEVPTSNYEIGRHIGNSILNSKQNLDMKQEDTKMNNKGIHTTDNKKTKALENNANILSTFEFPQLLQLHEKKEKEEPTNGDKIKEGIRNQILKKIDRQDDAEKKITESLKPKIYHKASLQNNLSILEPNSTEAGQYITNHPIGLSKENIKETTTITNFIQETPNYVQISDNKILENIVGAKDIEEEVNHTLNENALTTTTDKIDPLIILERIKFNLPPIKYYSPEILKYVTNRIDDKNVEITTASTNFIQKSLSNYAQDDTFLQNATETKEGNEMEYPLTTISSNLISSINGEYKPTTIISLTDKNILEPQQQNFTENNIIKIHEVTTEIQRTYAKTTYFKADDDSSRISLPSLTGETTNVRIHNDNENSKSNNDNNNLIDNKINNTEDIMKAIISSSKSSTVDDIYPPQLFPSSIASDDILELQRSQLYYINDDVKLPLEIKRLEDGSYALSISKNICEQILTRKCPCCVPLQGYIVRSLKNHQQEDMHATTSIAMGKKNEENILGNRDYQFQPFNTVTRRNVLRTQNSKKEDEEKERINEHHIWKQNDNNLTMISMPVIDFAKKYNLSLDFNKEKILLNKIGLQNKIQNYNKSIMKSMEEFEHQSEEKDVNNYDNNKKNELLNENNDTIDKFSDLINFREKKNTPNMNFPIFPITQKIFNLEKNSKEFEVREANAEINQSEINQELKLPEIETTNAVQNMNIIQKTNSENQENPVRKGINISEESKISKEEEKWDKLLNIAEGNTKVFHEKENRKLEATELIDNDYNVPENFKENIGKPYRYQRNANNIGNKGTELVKSMLYWLKELFVDN